MNRTTTGSPCSRHWLSSSALLFSGGTRTGARAFDEEPAVHLVVDPERGETRELKMEEYIQGVVGGEMGKLPRGKRRRAGLAA